MHETLARRSLSAQVPTTAPNGIAVPQRAPFPTCPTPFSVAGVRLCPGQPSSDCHVHRDPLGSCKVEILSCSWKDAKAAEPWPTLQSPRGRGWKQVQHQLGAEPLPRRHQEAKGPARGRSAPQLRRAGTWYCLCRQLCSARAIRPGPSMGRAGLRRSAGRQEAETSHTRPVGEGSPPGHI